METGDVYYRNDSVKYNLNMKWSFFVYYWKLFWGCHRPNLKLVSHKTFTLLAEVICYLLAVSHTTWIFVYLEEASFLYCLFTVRHLGVKNWTTYNTKTNNMIVFSALFILLFQVMMIERTFFSPEKQWLCERWFTIHTS